MPATVVSGSLVKVVADGPVGATRVVKIVAGGPVGATGVITAVAPATYDATARAIGVALGTTGTTAAAGDDARIVNAVQHVAAGDATIVIDNTDPLHPTVRVGALPESDVTLLAADLATLTGAEAANAAAITAANVVIATKAASAITLTAGTGLTGGGDLTVNRTFSLANTAVAPAAYGDASHSLAITVDAQGRLTAAAAQAIVIGEAAVTGLVADLASKAADSLVVHLAGTETITGEKIFAGALGIAHAGGVQLIPTDGANSWGVIAGTPGNYDGQFRIYRNDLTIASPLLFSGDGKYIRLGNSDGAYYSLSTAIYTGYELASPNNLFTAAASTHIPVVIRGAASQSADLTQWQNSAGTILSAINSAGALTFNAGENALSRTGVGAMTLTLARQNAASVFLISNPATGTGANTQFQLATDGGLISYQHGALSTSFIAVGLLTPGAAFGLALQGNYLLATYGANDIVMSTGGYLTSNERFRIKGDGSGAILTTGTAAGVGLKIKAAASATGDLQQWQKSDGTVLAAISASGVFVSSPPLVNGVIAHVLTLSGAWATDIAAMSDVNYVDNVIALGATLSGGTRTAPTYTVNNTGVGSAISFSGQTGLLSFQALTGTGGQTGRVPTTMIALNSIGVGLNGAPPVARAAAIATPTTDTVGTKAAIDAIRVALTNIGITA